MKTKHLFIYLTFIAVSSMASVTITDDVISLSSDAAVLSFSRDNGSIMAVSPKESTGSICRNTGPGLWSVHLENLRIDAAGFSAGNADKKFSFEKKDENAVDLIYECADLDVVVHVCVISGGFEFSATTTPAKQVLKKIELPAKISFDPEKTERLISPAKPDHSVGLALNRKFFSAQPEDLPSGWHHTSMGPEIFASLYGKGIPSPNGDLEPVKLVVTEEGRKWFSQELAGKINSVSFPVIRAQSAELCDLTLVSSARGAYFSGSKLGGKGGYIWRIGDGIRDDAQERIARSAVLATVNRLMQSAPDGRDRIALLDLYNGPETGGWSSISVAQWRGALWKCVADADRSFTFVSLRTLSELKNAMASGEYLCILNPYGELFPARDKQALMDSLTALKNYVHSGGNWFETAGYSFYQLLQPDKFLRYEAAYPPAYADLFHLQSSVGSLSLYRAQPRPSGDPWQAAGRHENIFVPASLFCGGDSDGGFMGRAFITWVKPGEKWITPKIHLITGVSLEKTIEDYCQQNSITQPLEKKIKADVLAKFKQAPLIYLNGPCKEKMSALDTLPVPSLIHFADYLHGGFDKQYPDHLPPNKEFGTQDEFKAFVSALHAKGHLFSPYTNPTWWCDDPEGPTFEKEGKAPLLINPDGTNRKEQYGSNPGWSTTLWHPAVQKVNRKVRTQFMEDLPVDLLFQDQCGARQFLYDFNPASPTPYAYSEGMISMNDEDSRLVPLGTEHGWDRVSEFQTMLCGLTWGIVPTRGGPSWRGCLKKMIPPQTWEIYPLAQAISHDKCIFGHHDLGQFVTDDRSLSWSLALGYHLSWRGNADYAKHDPSREWYAWLCRLQKSVASRYTGKALTSFTHDRKPMLERDIDHSDYDDDGVIKCSYDDVSITANLGPVDRIVNGRVLAGYGFYAQAPGMNAGILAEDASAGALRTAFVFEHNPVRKDLWLFAAPGAGICVPLPLEGSVNLNFGGKTTLPVEVVDGSARFSLPERNQRGSRIEPPDGIKNSAPCNWPGKRPQIGVLDLGSSVQPVWVKAGPNDWIEAIRSSSLGTLHSLEVKPVTSWMDLKKAFDEGPRQWLVIVNPYGERILSEKEGAWKQTLDEISKYVSNGGSWWETGGYSFFTETYSAGKGWKSTHIGPRSIDHLGLGIKSGDLEALPENLSVTREGSRWLGRPFTEKLNKEFAVANRTLDLAGEMPFTSLVQGKSGVYVGGYRLNGWGHLWRIGGMRPDPGFATSVMIAATLHQYTCPPDPASFTSSPRLWHAVIER